MEDLFQFTGISTAYMQAFFLTLVRITAIMLTAPILSSRNIPNMVKIAFAITLTLVILPLNTQNLPATLWNNLAEMFLAIAREILIGALVGFVTSLIFKTIQVAAHFLSLQMGFAFANVFDPMTQVQIAVIDQLYSMLALLFFLAINGHHMLIMAIQKTFDLVPLNTFSFNSQMAYGLIELTGQVLMIAARIAFPIMAVLILTDVVLAIMARISPQLQVFFLGLPLKIGLGLITALIVLPLTFSGLRQLFENSLSDTFILIRP